MSSLLSPQSLPCPNSMILILQHVLTPRCRLKLAHQYMPLPLHVHHLHVITTSCRQSRKLVHNHAFSLTLPKYLSCKSQGMWIYNWHWKICCSCHSLPVPPLLIDHLRLVGSGKTTLPLASSLLTPSNLVQHWCGLILSQLVLPPDCNLVMVINDIPLKRVKSGNRKGYKRWQCHCRC